MSAGYATDRGGPGWIAPFLAGQRRRGRLSTGSVAKRAGCASSMITLMESGQRTGSLDMVGRWAGALGFEIALVPVGCKRPDESFEAGWAACAAYVRLVLGEPPAGVSAVVPDSDDSGGRAVHKPPAAETGTP